MRGGDLERLTEGEKREWSVWALKNIGMDYFFVLDKESEID
jgi:hypothetical protein